jgi:threonine dehydrogenase-like Zn-dependent dehydrogenase
VLLDVAAVGICGTDYHIFQGKHPFLNYPRVIGHELSARIAVAMDGWSVGQLVVVNPYISCGTCRACQRGKPNCCMRIEVLGVHRDGGMCARIAVPVTNIYPAKGLEPIQAAMVEFLAIGAHAVRRSGIGPGDRVLVIGMGPIGLGTALSARLSGAEIHVTDLSPTRLDIARTRFGFERGIVSGDLLRDSSEGGFDTVFDATGNGSSMNAAFSLVGHGGSLVFVSVVKDTICFADADFHAREMTVIGSRNALKADFQAVMAAIRDARIDTSALCSEVLTLEGAETQLPRLAADRESLIKALVVP